MSEAKPTALLSEQIVEAVWKHVQRYSNGDIWMDTMRAKAEVSRLLRAQSPAQAEWQDIESAPKEGRIILGGEGKVGEGEWWPIDKMWSVDFEPSHWQPRPQPPITK